jgi:Zn/Cd-binding protein ZinT
MALEAAGAKVEDLLQDAMVRQRALSDYEDSLQDQLQKFETAKAEENRLIQAELDRLTKQYMSRIQANLDEVAGEQDELRTWQERKQKESERMTEAASYCVPQGNSTNGLGLAAMLERVDSHRR